MKMYYFEIYIGINIFIYYNFNNINKINKTCRQKIKS